MNNKTKLIFLILPLFILVVVGAYPIFFLQSNAQKNCDSTGKRREMKPILVAEEDNDLEKQL